MSGVYVTIPISMIEASELFPDSVSYNSYKCVKKFKRNIFDSMAKDIGLKNGSVIIFSHFIKEYFTNNNIDIGSYRSITNMIKDDKGRALSFTIKFSPTLVIKDYKVEYEVNVDLIDKNGGSYGFYSDRKSAGYMITSVKLIYSFESDDNTNSYEEQLSLTKLFGTIYTVEKGPKTSSYKFSTNIIMKCFTNFKFIVDEGDDSNVSRNK